LEQNNRPIPKKVVIFTKQHHKDNEKQDTARKLNEDIITTKSSHQFFGTASHRESKSDLALQKVYEYEQQQLLKNVRRRKLEMNERINSHIKQVKKKNFVLQNKK
jgi:hypothetical protein